jgi:uncharacterized protein (TIGR02444 family)
MTAEVFWRWALARYAHEPVRQHLLALQADLDLVVIEALFVCWLATEARRLREDDVDAMQTLITPWIAEVVIPLRTVRQRWKTDLAKAQQRDLLLTLEVEAERYLAELLWSAYTALPDNPSEARPNPAGDAEAERLNDNLRALTVFRQGEYAPQRQQLVALLLEST